MHSFPGFFRVPVYDVSVFIYNEIRRFDLMTRANAIAYSFFLALFPLVIFVFTLVPYFSDYILAFFGINTENFLEILQHEIQIIMPGKNGVGVLLFDTVKDLATKPQAGLLSIGFILALYFSSNGMLALMRGFDKKHFRSFKNRNSWKKYLIAIMLTGLLGLLMISSVILITLGQEIINLLSQYVDSANFNKFGLYVIRWIAILVVFYTGISLLYRYGASAKRKFAMFSPGATVATLLSILLSFAFSYYVDNYGRYHSIYGPIGTIIVLMIWIQLNSLILLIGFELNASISENRDLKKRIPEEHELTE